MNIDNSSKPFALLPLLFVCVLGAFQIVGYVFPSNLNWGFNFLGFLPVQYIILYTGCIILILVYAVKGKPDHILQTTVKYFEQRPFMLLLIAIICFIFFAILLRVRIPLLGDGFYLVRNYVEAFRGIAPLYHRDEPLATVYYSIFINALNANTYQKFLDAFLTADILLGVGFIINVFIMTRTLFTDNAIRFLGICLICLSPFIQLFCGYVETYAAVLYAFSLYAVVVVRYLDRKMSFSVIPPLFLIVTLVHYLSLLLLPSLVLLTYWEWKQHRIKNITMGYGVAVAIAMIVLLQVNFEMENYFSFVPYSHFLSMFQPQDILEQQSQAYTLFSVFHFIDIANALLLLCPTTCILIFMTYKTSSTSMFHHKIGKFFLSALVPAAIFFSLVKFDLGAARDWDVLAPYAFLLTVGAMWWYFQYVSPKTFKPIIIIILITSLHSVGFIVLNATEEPAIRRYVSLFDDRTLSQVGYYNGTLFLSQYYHVVKNPDEPITLWRKYIGTFPNDPRGYKNVINNYQRQGNAPLREIMKIYGEWQHHNPNDSTMKQDYVSFCLGAGNEAFAKGNFDEATLCYQKIIVLDAQNTKAYNNLGSVFAQQGNYRLAADMFRRAIALDSNYSDPYYNLGNTFIDQGKRQDGLNLIKNAAQLGNIQAQQDLKQQGIAW